MFKVSSRLPRAFVAVAFATPIVIVAAMAVLIAMVIAVLQVVVTAAGAANSAHRDAVPIAFAAMVQPVPMEAVTSAKCRPVKLVLPPPRRLHPHVVIRHREFLAAANRLRQ